MVGQTFFWRLPTRGGGFLSKCQGMATMRDVVLKALYKGFEKDPLSSAYSHPLTNDLGVEANLLAYISVAFSDSLRLRPQN